MPYSLCIGILHITLIAITYSIICSETGGSTTGISHMCQWATVYCFTRTQYLFTNNQYTCTLILINICTYVQLEVAHYRIVNDPWLSITVLTSWPFTGSIKVVYRCVNYILWDLHPLHSLMRMADHCSALCPENHTKMPTVFIHGEIHLWAIRNY